MIDNEPLVCGKGTEMQFKDKEIQMYGCKIQDFRESVESSITFKTTGPGMVIMCLMSDAQEQMEYGEINTARKTLNRAKFLMVEYGLGQNK